MIAGVFGPGLEGSKSLFPCCLRRELDGLPGLDNRLPKHPNITGQRRNRSNQMKRLLAMLSLLVAVGIAQPLKPAQAAEVDIMVGSTLWNGGKISCSKGARLLRQRAYTGVVMRDCWGRYYIYRAWRSYRYYEIALDSRTSRVVDRMRLR
jgi:hypothetical protein